MFSRPRRKKQSRAVSTSKGKLKPLPSINSGITGDSNSSCPSSKFPRNMATSKSRTSRSCSTGEGGKSTHFSRRGRVPGSQSHGTRESVCYKAFGRSSDLTLQEDASKRSMLPDPYAEMETNLEGTIPLEPNAPWWLFLAEMRIQAWRQADTLKRSKPDNRLGGKPDGKPDGSTCNKFKAERGQTDPRRLMSASNTAAAGGEPGLSPVVRLGGADPVVKHKEEGAGDDDINIDDDDDDDDEEDDEAGLPPAVYAMQLPKTFTPNAREVMRERHRARMEEIARTVDRADLLENLRTSGFFYYDYSNHARTTRNNHNLKNGKKKGIEKLLQLLSYKSPKGATELFGMYPETKY